MEKIEQKKYEARAAVLKAMAHPTRLFILDELLKNEMCVNDLSEMIDADTSTVSKHLSVLKGAGLVYTEKRSAKVFYRLRVPCIINSLSCIEKVLSLNAKEQLDLMPNQMNG